MKMRHDYSPREVEVMAKLTANGEMPAGEWLISDGCRHQLLGHMRAELAQHRYSGGRFRHLINHTGSLIGIEPVDAAARAALEDTRDAFLGAGDPTGWARHQLWDEPAPAPTEREEGSES